MKVASFTIAAQASYGLVTDKEDRVCFVD